MLILLEGLMVLVFVVNVFDIVKYDKFLIVGNNLPTSLRVDIGNAITNRVYVNFLLLVNIIALPIVTLS